MTRVIVIVILTVLVVLLLVVVILVVGSPIRMFGYCISKAGGALEKQPRLKHTQRTSNV